MKHLTKIAALAMAIGLWSCSSDEPTNGGGDNNISGTKYMAVRIQSVPDLGSRAAGTGFEEGEGNENTLTANKIGFFFFDNNGNPYTVSTIFATGITGESNMAKPQTITGTNTDGESTGAQGVLVLDIPEGKVTTPPSKVVCIANVDNLSNYVNKSLSTLLAEVNATPANWDSFVMTTSSYVDNGKVINYTDITNKLATTSDDAMKNPAEIFIERLAVKIRPKAENFTQEYTVKRYDNGKITDDEFELDNNGTKIKLNVTLTGWKPYNTVSGAYLIKNVKDTWTNDNIFTGWNNADLHRCYWASMPTSGVTFGQENNIQTAANYTTGTYYVYENTNQTNNTKMVVRAVISQKDDANATPIELVKWGGYYYTLDGFKSLVAKNANVDADKVTLVATADNPNSVDPNTWVAQVNGVNSEIYKNIYYWKNGVTSYVIDVKHLGNTANGTEFAVIRNHIYDYTFDNVIGLGIPGDVPEQPTQTDTYLAAKVYVLNWRVVTNNIILQ